MRHLICLFLLSLPVATLQAGTATITEAAAYTGQYGARFDLTSPTPVWLEDGSPSQDARYRARFYIKLDNLILPDGDRIQLFGGFDANQEPVFTVEIVSDGGLMYLDLVAYQSNGSTRSLASEQRQAMMPGYHTLEVDWAAGVGNGFMALWLDGLGRPGLESLNNPGLGVELVRIGSLDNASAGTFGYFDIDDFVSTRGSVIGPLCTSQEQFDQAIASWANGVDLLDLLAMMANPCQTPKTAAK